MESDPALNVYSEAKSEYMFQLTSHLTPAYFAFYIDLLERAKKEMEAEPKRHLWQFQNLLAEIEDWNMERVAREVASIQNRANCDFLDDLLTAVFIAHTKVLTAIRINSRKQKVQITVPKIDHFLLKVFCETAKLLWQSAYLFRENVGGIEKQQNYRQIQSIIENGIRTAIRAMIPVKSLLKDCVHDAGAESDSSSDSDDDEKPAPEPVSESQSTLQNEPAPEPAPATDAHVAEQNSRETEPATGVNAAVAVHSADGVHSAEQNSRQMQNSRQTETIHPVVAALLEPLTPAETVQAEPFANKPVDASPLIVVDAEPHVEFSEFETIFDTEEAEGNTMQPTQFHEGKNYDEEPGLQILDDIGTPLGDDDCDKEEAPAKLDYEELH